MRSTRENQRSIIERFGSTRRIWNAGCTPEDDAKHVEHQTSHVIVHEGKKYNKTALESSSTAMRNNTYTRRSITEGLGKELVHGEC